MIDFYSCFLLLSGFGEESVYLYIKIFGPVHEILVLLAYAPNPLINSYILLYPVTILSEPLYLSILGVCEQ